MFEIGKTYYFVIVNHDIIWHTRSVEGQICYITSLVAERNWARKRNKRNLWCANEVVNSSAFDTCKRTLKEISLIDAVENFKKWDVGEELIRDFLKKIEDG